MLESRRKKSERDWAIRILAVYYLGSEQDTPGVYPAEMIEAASDGVHAQRVYAAAMNSKHSWNRNKGEECLSFVKPQAELLQRVLVPRLTSKDPDLLKRLLPAFGRAGVAARPYSRRILRHVSHPDPEVRKAALQALQDIHPTWQSAGAIFQVYIRSKDSTERLMAIVAIGGMGQSAASMAPEFRRQLKREKQPRLRAALAETLGQISISNEEQLSAFITLTMKDPDRDVRRAALKSLAKGGLKAEAGAEDLLPRLTAETNPTLRLELVKTLQRILPGDHRAQPKLRQLEAEWKYAALVDRLRMMIAEQEQLSKESRQLLVNDLFGKPKR